MKKHFVVFMTPSECITEQPINSWNSTEAVKMAKKVWKSFKVKPCGFYFITKEKKKNDWDSQVTERSDPYYINGQIKTLEEIKAEKNPENQILIENLEKNYRCHKVVVACPPYHWNFPFREKDQIQIIEVKNY